MKGVACSSGENSKNEIGILCFGKYHILVFSYILRNVLFVDLRMSSEGDFN